jgi:hypothetical protein
VNYCFYIAISLAEFLEILSLAEVNPHSNICISSSEKEQVTCMHPTPLSIKPKRAQLEDSTT